MRTLLFALLGITFVLGTITTTISIPQGHATSGQQVKDGSAAAISDCDVSEFERAEQDNCLAIAGSDEPPQSCEECFDAFLTPGQIEEFENHPVGFHLDINAFCETYSNPNPSLPLREFGFFLLMLDIGMTDQSEIEEFIQCLKDHGILFSSL